MRRALLFVLPFAVFFGAAGMLYAQCETDCSQVCNSSAGCNVSCTDACSNWITCGQYGVCDPDPDDDGLITDNCPYNYNPNQADCDGDGVGNVCDSINANYVQVTNYTPCYIVSRLHFGYIDQRLYWEARFHDQSSCNSPDQWRTIDQVAYCYGTFTNSDHKPCCLDLWKNTINVNTACDLILNNNICHVSI